MNPHLAELLGQIIRYRRWDMANFGTQIMIEGVVLGPSEGAALADRFCGSRSEDK